MNQEVIGPQTAIDYLRSMGVNRKLRPGIVKRYEEEMRQNSWTLSSDAIAFDCNGNLIQGQHRLKAVVSSGLPQVFWVARNLPKEAKENLDCGSKRELHDRLTISGHRISKTVGSACLLLITPWQKPNTSKSKGYSPIIRSQVKTMHNHFYEELEWIDEQYGATSCNAAERAAGTMLLKATKNYELVKNYFSLVRKGENCEGLVNHGQKSPIVYRDLKNRYKALKKQTNDMTFYRLASSAAYNLSIEKDVHRLTSYANNPFTSAGIFRNLSFLTSV